MATQPRPSALPDLDPALRKTPGQEGLPIRPVGENQASAANLQAGFEYATDSFSRKFLGQEDSRLTDPPTETNDLFGVYMPTTSGVGTNRPRPFYPSGTIAVTLADLLAVSDRTLQNWCTERGIAYRNIPQRAKTKHHLAQIQHQVWKSEAALDLLLVFATGYAGIEIPISATEFRNHIAHLDQDEAAQAIGLKANSIQPRMKRMMLAWEGDK